MVIPFDQLLSGCFILKMLKKTVAGFQQGLRLDQPKDYARKFKSPKFLPENIKIEQFWANVAGF